MTRLILGTAQFGAAYGVTNAVGRISDDAMRAILVAADRAGIDTFDTSPEYGDAQARLAALAVGAAPRYIEKFALPLVEPFTHGLEGMLFHRTADLRDPEAVHAWDALRRARAAGDIRHIGASIYDRADLEVVAERFPDLDLLQLPASIVDRRLLDNPLVRELHSRGVEIHARSAYLQGLLLADPAKLPAEFVGLAETIEMLRAEATTRGVSVAALTLAYLREHPLVDAVVIGATTAAELEATVAAWNTGVAEPDFAVERLPDALLDPRQWPRREGPVS